MLAIAEARNYTSAAGYEFPFVSSYSGQNHTSTDFQEHETLHSINGQSSNVVRSM